jgi:hypothetical protein
MANKPYKTPENDESMILNDPVATYQRRTVKILPPKEWNPNVPFHGTQEEWWEHFHRIEEGDFETWEDHQKKFHAWKKEYLTNLM